MKESNSGEFKRGKSPFVEIPTSKGERYNTLASKAAKYCGITVHNAQDLCLFKINGAIILNKHSTTPWTLGGYAKAAKRSVEKLKIGVGCITHKRASQEEVH